MLKLKLPQALLPHITSTFGKVSLTLAAYSNMAEQFLSNVSNELGTNRHVLLGTHAAFSISSFTWKINNFIKLPCKESHSKQYVPVYYWFTFDIWNYLARCFISTIELNSDQRPGQISQMHLTNAFVFSNIHLNHRLLNWTCELSVHSFVTEEEKLMNLEASTPRIKLSHELFTNIKATPVKAKNNDKSIYMLCMKYMYSVVLKCLRKVYKNHPTATVVILRKSSALILLPGDAKDLPFFLQFVVRHHYSSFDLSREPVLHWCCCTDENPQLVCLSLFPHLSHQVPFFICLHSAHWSFCSAPMP